MQEPPVRRFDRLCVVALVLVTLGYGTYVEIRSAFLQRRHTDLGVYLRAAWAVREGGDPYAVTDENGWHYSYPVLTAIVLVPLADPPPEVARRAYDVPFPVSVALFYLGSVVAFLWAMHALARALDETHPNGPAPVWGKRWLWNVMWPFWICLPAIGSSQSRGQVNLFLVALIAAHIAAVLRGRRAAAGWWLAAATCSKVIPGLLILYPLLRRDWKCVGHYVLGMTAGMVLIPVVALGPTRAFDATTAFIEGTVMPGLTSKPGRLSRELTDMTATDNTSIQAIVHNALHLNRDTRPKVGDPRAKLAHVVIGVGLLVVTFVLVRRIADERERAFYALGGLTILTVALTPVNHMHYMVLAAPVVLGLVHREQRVRGDYKWGFALWLVVVVHVLSGVLPRLPFAPWFEVSRDLGLAMLGTLAVWWTGLVLPAARAERAVRAPRVGVLARLGLALKGTRVAGS